MEWRLSRPAQRVSLEEGLLELDIRECLSWVEPRWQGHARKRLPWPVEVGCRTAAAGTDGSGWNLPVRLKPRSNEQAVASVLNLPRARAVGDHNALGRELRGGFEIDGQC
jgi:hypothetical protein